MPETPNVPSVGRETGPGEDRGVLSEPALPATPNVPSTPKSTYVRNDEMEDLLGFAIEGGEGIEVLWDNLQGEWLVLVGADDV